MLFLVLYFDLVYGGGSGPAGHGRATFYAGINAQQWGQTDKSFAQLFNLMLGKSKLGQAGVSTLPSENGRKQSLTTDNIFFSSGPTQPEMQAFQPVNSSNMVDLFTGDFSYNIPLMDVGGYPINIGYKSGISMDQEASWVGLGWNINPGTITRNMRGLPDDFNGGYDTVTKTSAIFRNRTIGINAGADLELVGFPTSQNDTSKIQIGGNLGVFHNSYKGWGAELGLNASISAGAGGKGSLTGGLSITDNSQYGLSVTPSLSVKLAKNEAADVGALSGSFSTSLTYNSRSGIKGMDFSAGIRQYSIDQKNQRGAGFGTGYSSSISFATPSYTPTISLPYTSTQFSFTGKLGSEAWTLHPSFFLSGYVSNQEIKPEDQVVKLPAFGYLNYQNGVGNPSALLDFNREKEIPYRENPPVPNIAVPSYTYDIFSITGEGTGGMFRAYRGDIGYVYDHYMRTKDQSDKFSADLGLGGLLHVGADLNFNSSSTQSSSWVDNNPLGNTVSFRTADTTFENAYFRNPGEKTINSKSFYDVIGGDDVVTASLYQPGSNNPFISTSNYLSRYSNKVYKGTALVSPLNATRGARDKRQQVISYLNAKEAAIAGLSKYIENHAQNMDNVVTCNSQIPDISGNGTGLTRFYFPNKNLQGQSEAAVVDNAVNFCTSGCNIPLYHGPGNTAAGQDFSVRWTGLLKAPSTGHYVFQTKSDDGIRIWVNDSLIINRWTEHPVVTDTAGLNLVAGQFYSFKIEFYNHEGPYALQVSWSYPGQPNIIIPTSNLFPTPLPDIYTVSSTLNIEQRVNSFRKPGHISEITVLNADGRRYVYGIPVYNLKQKEVTFSVNAQNGSINTGFVKFTPGKDDGTGNTNGQDHYFSSEEIPAYAHSFLLSGIVSTDYVDLTGDGISDDDQGDAVKFSYTKIAGAVNPFKWRTPYVNYGEANYNQGLKTDSRDDKGSYVYGEKELWYLQSVESKTMIAVFTLDDRKDLLPIDLYGNKDTTNNNHNGSKLLREINLYSKPDLLKNGGSATPVKTVHFEYAYELCKGANANKNSSGNLVNYSYRDSGKLTLKKIWFTYNGNAKPAALNPYVFNYHNNNPSYNPKNNDRWGNFKDASQNPSGLVNAEYPYALQDSTKSAGFAAAWTLDSITLPSGGRIKVTYESDDYAYVQNKRAMQMLSVAGFAPTPASAASPVPYLYQKAIGFGSAENLFVVINSAKALANSKDIYYRYLEGINKLYFRLYVKMPGDKWGSGYEYVPCYADLDTAYGGGGYGLINANKFWVKMKGISLAGDQDGTYSPLAKAAVQYLRLNLPSKAYPGSDVGDNLDVADAVKIVLSLGTNILDAFKSFDAVARANFWATSVDVSKTFIRLDNPDFKRLGGGLRVKQVKIYDHWNAMSGQRESVYGQLFDYTTVKEVNGAPVRISSGVASYEPMVGGEENPFHQPVRYTEKVAPLAPVTLGYVEEPLGESFFPSAGVGYSKVRVRSINTVGRKSANGYEESTFYTAFDFPTITDNTMLDGSTKKRYKPAIGNFLHINAKNYLTLSQGFKVELNDMHGKLRSQATYAETDPVNPISYTENFYKVDNPLSETKHLANSAIAVDAAGNVDTGAVVGKDAEIMMDMRQQLSLVAGNNFSPNVDMFVVGIFPVVLPSFYYLPQHEEDLYRSVATTKVIQRYGILDSVLHIDKGSKVSTKNIAYDSETGDVLLSRTNNEFNDPIYNFAYPAHWAYDGMAGAYKNTGAVFSHLTIRGGKITAGIPTGRDTAFFAGGDELLIQSKPNTGGGSICTDNNIATFPSSGKLWAIDRAITNGGAKDIYFIDAAGTPFSGNDVYMKVIRSGRRNVGASTGSITMLRNPLVYSNGKYSLAFDTMARIVNASAATFRQVWKVTDRRSSKQKIACPAGYGYSSTQGTCIKDTAVVLTDTFHVCLLPQSYGAYTSCGSYYYTSFDSSLQHFSRVNLDTTFTDSLWVSSGHSSFCGYTPVKSLNLLGLANRFSDSSALSSFAALSSPWYGGPMNRSGVWLCNSNGVNTWYGFTVPVNIQEDSTYLIGFGADNQLRLSIDGTLFVKQADAGNPENFKLWHILPKYLSKGVHLFKIEAQNTGDIEGVGVQIYHNTLNDLKSAGTTADLNLIFSTDRLVGSNLPSSSTSSYACPTGYSLALNDSNKAVCRATYAPVYSNICASNITDTTVNPYKAGLLGNFRPFRGYTYYSNRIETDPSQATNIRNNGAFADFSAFWGFQNGRLVQVADTTRWVWNSETSLLNVKGMELENHDPLGRYNAGLYGYNLTLPVAVVQNSAYTSAAFEGFEDYSFGNTVCDTTCSVTNRALDFTAYAANLDTTQRHTGKYSLKVAGGQAVSLSFKTKATGYALPVINSIQAAVCSVSSALKGVYTDSSSLLPQFGPVPGDSMVLSLWVKESQDCNCTAYTRDQVTITLNSAGGAAAIVARPSGILIEGWQRYETVIPVSSGATSVSLSLQATLVGTDVWFDDIRLHPYRANMKSFVYHPVNLRLMAELDENNYATFYEYDDDGTLARVKKETQRGIQTIKETRSYLSKYNNQ